MIPTLILTNPNEVAIWFQKVVPSPYESFFKVPPGVTFGSDH